MDCRKFEEIAGDVAEDRLMLATVRSSALIHAATCERCAAHLAARRALDARLIEFAEATATRHASPHVKQRLRAAVAERRPASAAPVAAIEHFRKPNWGRWALAAAATILLLFTIAVAWLRGAHEELANVPPPAPATVPTPPPAMPLSPSVTQRDATAALKSLKANVRRRGGTDRVAEGSETASAFIPLTLEADEKSLENGTLVRMAVSRSRLVAMGVPLHLHGGQETVNAEVMLGDNGVAYAIRVVR
jgi:hypothetical protein